MAKKKPTPLGTIMILVVIMVSVAAIFMINSMGWFFSPMEVEIIMMMIVVFAIGAFAFQFT